MRSDLELAWAAGFFDGEGSTICSGASLQMALPQVEQEPLRRFADAVGVGNIGAPRMLPNRRPIRCWRAYGPSALTALQILSPYLSTPKRRQAVGALISYSMRRVHIPGQCRRGHRMDPANTYRSGCITCREARRMGPLPPIVRPRALDLRPNLREYGPLVMT